MPKIKEITSFKEYTNHMFDDYKNHGYNYEQHILQNVVSQELFANPVNDTPMRQIERLFEHLINAVRKIKLTYAIVYDKNAKNIN